MPSASAEPAAVLVSDKKLLLLQATGAHSAIDWKRVAYARTVHSFDEVCEAAMLFAELTRQRSAAQKVLLYPAAWDTLSADQSTHAARTALRLLAKARRDFKAALVPLGGSSQLAPGADEGGSEQRADEDLATLLALTTFDRVVYLQPKGLVLDVELLDGLFGLPVDASVTPIDAQGAWPHQSLMVRPSLSLARRPGAVRENLPRPLLAEAPLAELLLQTSALRDPPEALAENFNHSTFYDYTAYVTFTEADIPGPEFDLPAGTFARVQPSSAQHRAAWRSLYERFRMERMAICGLDLQPIVHLEI